MTGFLDNLPPEVATDLARNRIIGVEEAAQLYNSSVPHFRRLYREDKVPKPIKVGARKLGWRLGVLIDDLQALKTEGA